MSYQKAMRHHNNPRKWKMTPARRRGNQLVFGVPATEKSTKEVTKEQPMSDTLQEREDRMDTERINQIESKNADWCDDCHGYTHMPWCPAYKSDKEVGGTFQRSRAAKYPAKVLAELTAAGEINNEQYQRLRRETVESEHQPAAQGGDEQSQLFPRYSFAVVTGRYKILDNRSDGPVRITQIATADGEDEARLIVQALNQHHSLVAERERLAQILKAILDDLFQNQEQVPPIPAICELYAEGRTVLEAIEQRSTSECGDQKR